MKRTNVLVVCVCLLAAIAFAASKGQVKTNKVNFGLTGGSDADDTVKIERPSAAVMRFTSGAGVATLGDLISASATSRTGITAQSGFQASTIAWAGNSNVRFATGAGGVRSFFGAAPQQMEWMTQNNPMLWETNVYQEGVSGDTTALILARIDDIMDHAGIRTAGDPDIVIIQVGGNDFLNSAVALSVSMDNMTSITNAILTSGSIPVLVGVMDMDFGPFAGDPADQAELDGLINAYNAALKTLAQQLEVAYFDLFEVMGDPTGSRLYVDQTFPSAGGRLHFSAAGQKHLATEMLNFLMNEGLINHNGQATKPEILEYNDPRIVLENQGSLTAASNETLTVTDGSDEIVNHDYREMTNETGGDIQIASFTFFGTGVAIIAGTGDLGQLDVTIDSGTPEEVELFRDASVFESVVLDTVWSIRDLDYAEHTLEIELKNTAPFGTNQKELWFFGLVVERGAANNPIITDFPTVISAPSMTIEDIDTSDDTITGLLTVTGDNSASPRQTVIITDADFEVEKTGSENLFTGQQILNRVGLKVTAPELGVHMESGDGVLLRDTRAAATVFSPIMTRDDYSDGDIDAITWGESVGGALTDTEMATLAMVVDDATPATVTTTLLFSTAIDDALAPVAQHNHDFTKLFQRLWVQGSELSGQTPGDGTFLFLDNSELANFNTLAYAIADPAGGSGWFMGDDDNQGQGGIFYNHALDFLRISADATNIISLDGPNEMVGIRVETPEATLHVQTSDSGVAVSASFDDLLIEAVTSAGSTIGMSTTGQGGYVLGDSVDADSHGFIGFGSSHATLADKLLIKSGGVNTMWLDGNNVGIGTDTPLDALHLLTAINTAGDARFNVRLVDSSTRATGVGGGIAFGGDISTDSFGQYAAIWAEKSNASAGNSAGKLHLGTSPTGSSNISSRIAIDESGNVGVMTELPDGTLHVHTATAGSIAPNSGADDLTVENSSDAGITILSPDTDNAQLYFGSPSNNSAGQIEWGFDDQSFRFTTNEVGAEVIIRSGNNVQGIRITGDQDVSIGLDTTPDSKLVVSAVDYDPPGGPTAGLLCSFVNSSASTAGSPNNKGIGIQAGSIDATTTGDAEFIEFFDGNATPAGDISMAAGVLDFNEVSDRTKKRNIRDSQKDTKSIIRNMKLRDFEWKGSPATETRFGVVAQEVYEVYPDAVSTKTRTVELDTGTTISIPTTVTVWVEITSGTLLVNASSASIQLIDTWVPDTEEVIDWYWRPVTMIPVLMKETQRQQVQINYLWGAVGLLLTVSIALITSLAKLYKIVRKIANGQPLTPEDLEELQRESFAGMKDQLEAKKEGMEQ